MTKKKPEIEFIELKELTRRYDNANTARRRFGFEEHDDFSGELPEVDIEDFDDERFD